MRSTYLIVSCLLCNTATLARADDHWPQFRGSNACNVGKAGLPDKWDAKSNVVWQADIKGRGWSSPVVWGDRIFVTAVVNDMTPEPKKGLYADNLYGKTPPGEHRWVVYCVDFKTGKVLWEKTAHTGMPTGTIHLKNTYASETPVTDGERIYAYFGNHGLFCYDMAGKEAWKKDLGSFKTRFGWGTAASPVVHKGRLYVIHDNDEKSFLVALDAKSGNEIWRVERKEGSNWATPFIWENELRTEIITCGSGKVRSYSLDGKPLWELKGMSAIAIPTPSASGGLLFITSGYILDKTKPLYAIRPGGDGDISLGKDETSNKYIAWCQPQAGPYHPSPIVYGDYVYVLLDKGFLSCYEAKTGKEVYLKQRLGDSDKFTSSPWACDGKIYCLGEDSETFVIKAGPKFEVLARNPLDDDMCLATPAVVRGSLIVRTASKLYRIEKKGIQ